MGLFSGVTKAFKSVLPVATTALGYYLGGPIGGTIGGGLGGMASKAGSDPGSTENDGGFDWLGSLGSLAGSAFSQYMQQDQARKSTNQLYDQSLQGILAQNASARGLAQQANEFNVAQAQKQMDFQERMANTAHQREVSDLRAAGLNPILSGTGGMGASAPSGASASANVAPVANTGAAVTSAFDAFKSMADAMKANAATTFMSGAQTAQTQAQTSQTQAQTQLTESQTLLTKAQRNKVVYESANIMATNPKIKQEIENLKTLNANYQKTGRLTDAQTQQVKQTTANLYQSYLDLRMKGAISDSELGKLLEIGKRTTDVTGNLDSLVKIFKGRK